MPSERGRARRSAQWRMMPNITDMDRQKGASALQVPAGEATDASRWAALVFTQRQACAYVLNELVLRMPAFSAFLLSGAHFARVVVLQARSELSFCNARCNGIDGVPLLQRACGRSVS